MTDPTNPSEFARAKEDQLRKVTIGELKRIDGPIALVEYDPAWPSLFEQEVDRVRDALDNRVLRIEHVGSTSVQGLAAKRIIDILLVVADTADEAGYVPDLEAAGYILRIREPGFRAECLLDFEPLVNTQNKKGEAEPYV